MDFYRCCGRRYCQSGTKFGNHCKQDRVHPQLPRILLRSSFWSQKKPFLESCSNFLSAGTFQISFKWRVDSTINGFLRFRLIFFCGFVIGSLLSSVINHWAKSDRRSRYFLDLVTISQNRKVQKANLDFFCETVKLNFKWDFRLSLSPLCLWPFWGSAKKRSHRRERVVTLVAVKSDTSSAK